MSNPSNRIVDARKDKKPEAGVSGTRPRTKLTRRNFLIGLGLMAVPAAMAVDGFFIERHWLRIKYLNLAGANQGKTHRIAHFTDVHHKGDKAYLERVVNEINALEPDIACFTGDLIERMRHCKEALAILEGIECPLYGVPGNHDFWGGSHFDLNAEAFARTGGAWLMDGHVLDGRTGILISGGTSRFTAFMKEAPVHHGKHILLCHYPKVVDETDGWTFDAILTGHSHGGQVRLPVIGAIVLPFDVGRYELGLYETPAGPLYVNPGIGTNLLPIRFLCRPEITLIEI